MGKRKYDSENKDSHKKVKKGITIETEESHEQPQNDGIPENKEKNVNFHAFDVKHFRKEIVGKQGQTMGELDLIFIERQANIIISKPNLKLIAATHKYLRLLCLYLN